MQKRRIPKLRPSPSPNKSRPFIKAIKPRPVKVRTPPRMKIVSAKIAPAMPLFFATNTPYQRRKHHAPLYKKRFIKASVKMLKSKGFSSFMFPSFNKVPLQCSNFSLQTLISKFYILNSLVEPDVIETGLCRSSTVMDISSRSQGPPWERTESQSSSFAFEGAGA